MSPYYRILNKQLSFLVLDFNRPGETYTLLESLRKHVKLENYEIVLYSNGGEQDYAWDFYKHGLTDKVIFSKTNEGSGVGTLKLVEYSNSDFILNVQNDHRLVRDFEQVEYSAMLDLFRDNPKVGGIDFAELGPGIFSERAFLTSKAFYLENPLHEGGGNGPYVRYEGTENAMTRWLQAKRLEVITWRPPIFTDTGMYSIIESEHGGVFRRRTDSQELWVAKIPTQPDNILNLNATEWEDIMAGRWRDGRIPEASISWIRLLFTDSFDTEQPGIQKILP